MQTTFISQKLQDVKLEIPIPGHWGICLDGDQEPMLKALQLAVQEANRECLQYVEIGLAEAATFSAMSRSLRSLAESRGKIWRSIGLDLPDGWSLNLENAKRNLGDLLCPQDLELGLNHANILLMPSQRYLTLFPSLIDYLFIDGCHGRKCAHADFIAAEQRIPVGGIVVFHDAAEQDQGLDMQPHCNETIGVRAAIHDLGLFHGLRPNWKLLADVVAPYPNRGVAIFQKVPA